MVYYSFYIILFDTDSDLKLYISFFFAAPHTIRNLIKILSCIIRNNETCYNFVHIKFINTLLKCRNCFIFLYISRYIWINNSEFYYIVTYICSIRLLSFTMCSNIIVFCLAYTIVVKKLLDIGIYNLPYALLLPWQLMYTKVYDSERV